MKKFTFAIALLLVLAFASTAFAAQASYNVNGTNYYSSTTPSGVRSNDPTTIKRVYAENQFKADGKTNYPYEIYLPNEQAPENYRIHSNYSKNTDACAACHATHTAVGNSLLQWYSVYDTCMACHDGTVTTTYNVVDGKIAGTGANTKGGLFGIGTHDSASNHNVTGAVEIAAAPGGSVVPENVNVNGDSSKQKTRWGVEFGCQSCHTPYGQGGNYRILNPDPNFTATAARKASYAVDASGNVLDGTTPVYILKGYPYTVVIKNGSGTVVSEAYIDNTSGVSKVVYPGGTVDASFTVIGTAAIQIKASFASNSYLQGNETITYNSGMNTFCGACHTDYNTAAFVSSGSANTETGTYSKAHRHQVGTAPDNYNTASELAKSNMPLENGKMFCLTCHFAHGTNADYWERTLNAANPSVWGSDASSNEYQEIAGSSALKRLPNMGTCEACHQKGDANEGYGTNTALGNVSPVKGVTDGVFAPAASNVFANYVGSTTCQNCHQEQYTGWSTTTHKKMIQDAQANGQAAIIPDDSKLASSDLVPWYNTVFGTSYDLATVKSKIAYTIGSKWKQRYIFDATSLGYGFVVASGNTQYNVATQTWAAYGSVGTVPSKLWSDGCILCHVTGWNGGETTNVAFKEPGVGCEACHGAGANHVKAPSAKNILSGKTGNIQNDTVLCGKCHSRGYDLVKKDFAGNYREDWFTAWEEGKENSFADLQSTYGLVYNNVANVTTYRAAYYGDWNGFSKPETNNVYPDETAKGHHQQFNEFLQSGHFKSGLLSCTTCHDPHKKNIDGEMLVAQSQSLCASCHDKGLDLDQYMPYISKSATNRPYDDKTNSFKPATTAGGDLRSHIFRAQDFVYTQSSPNNPTTPVATAAPLK